MNTMEDLNKKVQEIQSELKAPKSQKNQFANFNYRSAEDILEALKPLLASRGLALFISDEVLALGDRYYVVARVTVTDGKDRIEVTASAREEETKKGMDAAQITGSASSYARKYALNGMFAIDDTKDADSHDNTKHVSVSTKASAVQKIELQKAMKDKGMDTEQMGLFVSSVLNKERVDTTGDYEKVKAALEEK